MLIEHEEDSVKTRRIDYSAFKTFLKIKLRMKFLRVTAPSPHFQLTKVKVASWSILFILLSETVRIRASAVCTWQAVLLFYCPRCVNQCMYPHTAHKESILAHMQPQEAGPCGPGLSGNWQPFSSCKQQPNITSGSGDSGPTSEILNWQNCGRPGFDHLLSHLSKRSAEKFVNVGNTRVAL